MVIARSSAPPAARAPANGRADSVRWNQLDRWRAVLADLEIRSVAKHEWLTGQYARVSRTVPSAAALRRQGEQHADQEHQQSSGGRIRWKRNSRDRASER